MKRTSPSNEELGPICERFLDQASSDGILKMTGSGDLHQYKADLEVDKLAGFSLEALSARLARSKFKIERVTPNLLGGGRFVGLSQQNDLLFTDNDQGVHYILVERHVPGAIQVPIQSASHLDEPDARYIWVVAVSTVEEREEAVSVPGQRRRRRSANFCEIQQILRVQGFQLPLVKQGNIKPDWVIAWETITQEPYVGEELNFFASASWLSPGKSVDLKYTVPTVVKSHWPLIESLLKWRNPEHISKLSSMSNYPAFAEYPRTKRWAVLR